MNKLKSYGSKHLYDSLLPCVTESVSWLVYERNRHFFFFKIPEREFFWRQSFLKPLMSQEGDAENEMPLGEGQENSEL